MNRAATAALASLALALAGLGCGSGEESAGSGASASPPDTAAANRSAADSSPPSSSASRPHTEQKPPPELPPPTPGSKAAAPGVPTSKHGDNSIQTWGREAPDTEREAATATVQTYLDARAAGDWAKVCALLAAKSRREQEQFGGGTSCAKAMGSFAADASTAVLEEEAEIEVLSFRIGDKYTFLIYRRPDGVYANGLVRKAGRWKLLLVTPTLLQ
jgi:hypothetical protein